MPFIIRERRDLIDNGMLMREDMTPGDLCYTYYKDMVDKWKLSPRWTTAHNIFKSMMESTTENVDEIAAQALAWQVFFIKYVMKYEDEKEEMNGSI